MPDPFALYEQRGTRLEFLVGYVDGYLTEDHERQVTVTRFPLESGASLSDHAVREPDVVKLGGWTSDLFPVLAADIPLTDRPARAWAEIDRVMTDQSFLTVATVLGVYPDMIVTRAVAPVSSRTGRGLLFTLELQTVQTEPLRRVEFQVVQPAANSPAEDRYPDRELELDLPNAPITFLEDEDDVISGTASVRNYAPGLQTYSPTVNEVHAGEAALAIGASTVENMLSGLTSGDLDAAGRALVEGGSALGTVVGDWFRGVDTRLAGGLEEDS